MKDLSFTLPNILALDMRPIDYVKLCEDARASMPPWAADHMVMALTRFVFLACWLKWCENCK